MFDEIIAQLDAMGIKYTEDYEAGTLTIDVASMDKEKLIGVIQALNDTGLPFSIDASSIVVTGIPSEDTPAQEVPMEEAPAEGSTDPNQVALDEAMQGF